MGVSQTGSHGRALADLSLVKGHPWMGSCSGLGSRRRALAYVYVYVDSIVHGYIYVDVYVYVYVTVGHRHEA